MFPQNTKIEWGWFDVIPEQDPDRPYKLKLDFFLIYKWFINCKASFRGALFLCLHDYGKL
jgi:hypothetical protein